MRSKLIISAAIGFSTLAVARYLPAVVKDDGQKHLFRRQMENNPFSPKPIVSPQITTIRITDEEGVESGGDGEEEGDGSPQTPRFSDPGNEPALEPPSFKGVGLTHAVDNINLEGLESGPNLIDPYAEIEVEFEVEQIRPERVEEPQRSSNLGFEPNTEPAGADNPGREPVRSEDEEFYDVEEPTEEQEQKIKEDLEAQLQATLANQVGAPAREGDEIDEFVADIDNLDDVQGGGSVSTDHNPGVGENVEDLVDLQLKDVEELFPGPETLTDPKTVEELLINSSVNTEPIQELLANPPMSTEATQELPPKTEPEINLSKIANLDQSYFPRSAFRSRQQRAPVQPEREGEEEKADPESIRVQARLKELYGIEPRKDDRKERSKSSLRKFGSFVASLPGKGVETIVKTVTGRGRRNTPATIASSTNQPPTLTTGTHPNTNVVQQIVEYPSSNNQPVTQPPKQAVDTEISMSSWGKLGKDVYDAPMIAFSDAPLDEEEIQKSYYKRRLR